MNVYITDWNPRTAKQIADQLKLPASKVHYHVKELALVGLLVLTMTKEKNGIVEKYFLPRAKGFTIKFSHLEGNG